jgi:hypothetical protein
VALHWLWPGRRCLHRRLRRAPRRLLQSFVLLAGHPPLCPFVITWRMPRRCSTESPAPGRRSAARLAMAEVSPLLRAALRNGSTSRLRVSLARWCSGDAEKGSAWGPGYRCREGCRRDNDGWQRSPGWWRPTSELEEVTAAQAATVSELVRHSESSTRPACVVPRGNGSSPPRASPQHAPSTQAELRCWRLLWIHDPLTRRSGGKS